MTPDPDAISAVVRARLGACETGRLRHLRRPLGLFRVVLPLDCCAPYKFKPQLICTYLHQILDSCAVLRAQSHAASQPQVRRCGATAMKRGNPATAQPWHVETPTKQIKQFPTTSFLWSDKFDSCSSSMPSSPASASRSNVCSWQKALSLSAGVPASHSASQPPPEPSSGLPTATAGSPTQLKQPHSSGRFSTASGFASRRARSSSTVIGCDRRHLSLCSTSQSCSIATGLPSQGRARSSSLVIGCDRRHLSLHSKCQSGQSLPDLPYQAMARSSSAVIGCERRHLSPHSRHRFDYL